MPTGDAISPLTMAILLALASEELHGYALMQEIAAQTGERPGTGSLYAALQRLEEDGLIEGVQGRPGEDRRRRYFRITRRGRASARAEAQRMLDVVELARARALLPALETGGRR